MLYQLFEDTLICIYESICHFNIHQVTTTFVWSTSITLYILYISFKYLINNIKTLVDCLIHWKKQGFLGVFLGLFDELKIIVFVIICIVTLYRSFYVLHINPTDPININFGDTQNVHDTAVNKYVIESVKKLGQKPTISFSTIYTEILNYLRTSSNPKHRDAIDVLNHIQQVNMNHMGTNLSETEILTLVWQRINHPINFEHISDLKESLLIQLSDCKENGQIVCVVGRITRILQTLECIDSEQIVNLHPIWAVEEEIGYLCAKYVQKLMNKLPKEYTLAVNAFERTTKQELLASRFYSCVKSNLKRKFKLIYVDTNILTMSQLGEISKEYFDELQ